MHPDDIILTYACIRLSPRPNPCVRRLAARLQEAGGPQPEVCVMAGGWRRFQRELGEDDFKLGSWVLSSNGWRGARVMEAMLLVLTAGRWLPGLTPFHDINLPGQSLISIRLFPG